MTDSVLPTSSIDTDKHSNAFREKRKTKVKYLKYSPPPSAGPGPGAWRQNLGQGLPPGTIRHYSPDDSDLDVISLSLDVANVSIDFKDSASGRVNYNGNQKNHNSKNRGKKHSGARNGMSSAFTAATPSTPSDPLVFNGKWTRRSTSNRLLNCFTIDDCMARYRTRLALGHGGPEAWATAKAELAYALDTFPNPQHPMDAKSTTNEGMKTRKSHAESRGVTGRGSPASRRETSFDDSFLPEGDGSDSCNNSNEALSKAMNTILSSNEVVNNTARTGLFRKSKRASRREKRERPESTRFRKMNDTLHKWIDEEIILPRSRLGSMNSLRSRSEDDRGAGQAAAPRSAGYRGPRSMDAPPNAYTPNAHRQDSSRLKETRPWSAEDGVNASRHKGPHRSDSFLEMLMELDEDKRPAGSDGQPKGDDTDHQRSVDT